MSTVRISSAQIRKSPRTVQSGAPVVTMQPTQYSTPSDQQFMDTGEAAIILVTIKWIVELLQSRYAVELSDVVLRQIGQREFEIVDAKVDHKLTIKASSEWKADVVVYVGQQMFRHTLSHESREFHHDIKGPGTMAIKIIPLEGKGVEIIGNVSFNVSCNLYLENGIHVGGYQHNGWEPRNKIFSSETFRYV